MLCECVWSIQQLLGSGSTLAALQENCWGFSAALQEADLSKYQLRLPYSCTNSAVLPCWKLLPSPLKVCRAGCGQTTTLVLHFHSGKQFAEVRVGVCAARGSRA